MRELTQVEYNYLWGDLHRDPVKFASFLIDYNLVVSKKRQIPFYHGKRGHIPVTVVHRESLPMAIQDELDSYESTLKTPFVGGCKIIPLATYR